MKEYEEIHDMPAILSDYSTFFLLLKILTVRYWNGNSRSRQISGRYCQESYRCREADIFKIRKT